MKILLYYNCIVNEIFEFVAFIEFNNKIPDGLLNFIFRINMHKGSWILLGEL